MGAGRGVTDMFSVIVPVYNAASTLERCVESILNSQRKDLQIILIEDRSKDNSWQICCTLAEKYSCITALQNDRNRGVSYTRNRGLDAAIGEYLLFVDSDDWVEPEWSSALLDELQREPHCMPVCGYQLENDTSEEKRQCLWAEHGLVKQVALKDAFDLLDKVLLQQLWTKAFYREIVVSHRIRFDETQSMGEDLQFILDYLEAAHLQGFSMISKPLYHYSCNTGTLMRSFGLVNRDEEYKRLLQLGKITGNQERCDASLEVLKKNHVYHILRSNLSGREKRALAREILGKQAISYCSAQKMAMLKERIFRILQTRSKK
jgi:glycosyltransferase involved in cell wall biosynthesis